MRTIIPVCLMMAAGLIASSCVSSKPVHYYTLGTVAPPPASRSKPDGLVILVGSIATPEALQDGRIRYRSGPNEAGAYEYHRWTERPGTMVQTALLRALRATGNYQRVLEAGSAVNGDYLLRGKLHEFGEVDGAAIQTRISLHVELIDQKTNRNVWDHIVDRQEPVSGKTVPEVVESLDRNLAHVVNQTVAEVDKALNNSALRSPARRWTAGKQQRLGVSFSRPLWYN